MKELKSFKIANVMYAVAMTFAALLLLLEIFLVKVDVFRARENERYQELTDYQQIWVDDALLPVKGKDRITLTVTADFANEELVFQLLHQGTDVYLGEELVYSVHTSAKSLFGRTPGNNWVVVPICKEDVGKTLCVDLIPAYSSSKGSIPTIYLGEQWVIFFRVLKESVLSMLLAVNAIAIGVVFILWQMIGGRRHKKGKNLFYLGMFSVWLGLWKIFDTRAAFILFPDHAVVTTIPLVALMLMIVPFMLFMQSLFTGERRHRGNCFCFCVGIYIVAAVVFQLFDLFDIRQLLPVTHLFMGGLVILGVWNMWEEIRSKGWSTGLKVTVFGLMACFGGLVIDLIVYKSSRGRSASACGMVCFLTYIIVVGVRAFLENISLAEKGRKAELYKRIAYEDPVTGLGSRAAYEDYVESLGKDIEHCVLVMCDLNNLKYCNDTYGHEAGDRYLLQSAKLIKENFGGLGKCFRIGGDEFCVVIKSISDRDCERAVASLREMENAYNCKNPDEFSAHIACGFVRFDKEVDYDINDAIRRADKLMYLDKLRLKNAGK